MLIYFTFLNSDTACTPPPPPFSSGVGVKNFGKVVAWGVRNFYFGGGHKILK